MRTVKVALIAVFALCAFRPAAAVPLYEPIEIPDDAVNVGYLHLNPHYFEYDASTGLMTSRTNSTFLFTIDESGNIEPPAVNSDPGYFEFTAQVDAFGAYGGSASLILDLGNGPELFATAAVTDFGFEDYTCHASDQGAMQCIFSHPELSFTPTFLDARVEAILGDFWRWRGRMQFFNDGPFLDSVVCGPDDTRCWNSHDFLQAYNIPEPGTLALLGIGFVGIWLAQRRLQSR